MTLQEVKQFLRDNALTDEVKSYMAELSKVSPEVEEKILESYKKSQEFKSELDRAVTKGINTYTEKTLPGIITEKEKAIEMKVRDELNPPKNPEVIQLTEKMKKYETQITENNKKIMQKEIRNMKQALLNAKGIPIEYADLIPVNTDGLTIEDIEDVNKLTELITPSVDKLYTFGEAAKIAKATEMQSRGAYKPTDSNGNIPVGQLTKEAYEALPRDERMKAQKEGRVRQILGQ
jgi:soluble cytochrome b562